MTLIVDEGITEHLCSNHLEQLSVESFNFPFNNSETS